jgi:hypothetical protein
VGAFFARWCHLKLSSGVGGSVTGTSTSPDAGGGAARCRWRATAGEPRPEDLRDQLREQAMDEGGRCVKAAVALA